MKVREYAHAKECIILIQKVLISIALASSSFALAAESHRRVGEGNLSEDAYKKATELAQEVCAHKGNESIAATGTGGRHIMYGQAGLEQ